MVHNWVLPLPRQHLDNREYFCRAQGAPPGIGTASGGVLKRQPGGSRGYNGGADSGRVRGHVGPLPPTTAPMVPGREDVEHGTAGEGGEVPDGLHPGVRLSSLQELARPVPTA